MATEVFIANGPDRAKQRNPWGVLGLSLITLGIYGIFWWYFINREMRDLGRAKGVSGLGDNPGLSTAAYTLGALIYIPWIWTIVTTTQRAQRSQLAQGQEAFSGWLAAVVYILTLGIGMPVFLQYQMNDIWRDEPIAPPPGTPRVGGAADLDRLTKLNELRESGAITEEEYDAEKARVLPAAAPSAPAASAQPVVGQVSPQETTPPQQGESADAENKPCPSCGQSVKAAAHVCKYCGYRWEPPPPAR